MALTAGTRVGAYEVVELVGEGGMGEVYRASDTRLKRDVALKMLPASVAADPDRLLRFAREAEMLAALNHPNIASIYGVEEFAGVRALVMELVDGETLADHIARGPVPVPEALAIARQIALALESAHEQGIIHRDLKPANIKLRDDGTVKVLDFGLAKLADPIGTASGGSSLSLSPTITSPALMTNAGMLLGTAAYMSPEQAKGRPADKRSDLWAFGCVLFEMLTGTRAFEAEDISETLAAVLRGEPDWAALPKDVPAAMQALLRRFLAKDRGKRPSGMAAVLFVLDEFANLSSAGGIADETAFRAAVDAAVVRAGAARARTARIRLLMLTAGAVLLALGAGAATWYATRPAPAVVTKLALTAGSGPQAQTAANSADLAITPDGSRVVYFSGLPNQTRTSTLAVRALDQIDARPLSVVQAFGPFVSPDGQWVGFNAQGDGALNKMPVHGGPVVPIVSKVGGIRGASWTDDDTIIFGSVTTPGLWRVPAAGGEATQMTKPLGGQREVHAWPDALPGGRHVLFTITSVGLDDSRVALLDLQTRTHRVIIERGTYPRYSKTGHILYASGGTIFAVGFDVEQLSATTTPVAVVDGVITKESGAASFDIADNGTLVYTPGSAPRGARTIAWVDRQGRPTTVASLDPGEYRSLRLNRDATQLVFESGPVGDSDLWTLDLVRGVRNPLTRGNFDDRNPLWTADGRRVVFGSNRDGAWGVFAVNADGSGSVERLLRVEEAVELWPSSWSPDHQTLGFSINNGGDGDIGLIRIGDAKVDWRLRTSFIEGLPAISPDGRWIAYASQRSGSNQLYLERFPETGDRQVVSSEGVQGGPLWSRDGRELYYLDRTGGQMIAVPIRPGEQIGIGKPRVLFKVPVFVLRGWRTYDVAPDGRFIIITADNPSADAGSRMPIAMQNWAEELKRRVPVN